ncbi:MAG: hypothetical protein IJD25_02675, partial [Alphaproteobacteria bacterium]|nr:hypothetical protein [Alphaproteobacteria bacterium]
MTNYSRTTLRELKKRYLNILKKCLLANLGIILLSTPSMAEPTTYTAEEIYERLTNGQGVTVSGQTVGPVQGGYYTSGLSINSEGSVSFNGHAEFSKLIRLDGGGAGLHFESAHFNGGNLIVISSPSNPTQISFSGDLLFENSIGNAYGTFFLSSGKVSFRNVEFYGNKSSTTSAGGL